MAGTGEKHLRSDLTQKVRGQSYIKGEDFEVSHIHEESFDSSPIQGGNRWSPYTRESESTLIQGEATHPLDRETTRPLSMTEEF